MRDRDVLARYPADRTLRWRWAVGAAALGGGAFLVSSLTSRVPFLVERWYTSGIWPLLSRPLSIVTGIFPLSVAELLLAAYIVSTLILSGQALRDVVTGRRRWWNAMAGGVRRSLLHGGLALAAFYGIWGLNYSRPAFEARVEWPAWDGIDTAELIVLAEQSVHAANDAYFALHGTADAGVPTGRPRDPAAHEAAIDQGWKDAAHVLGLDRAAGLSFGRIKRPLSSGLMAHLGISGLYVPFTGEATVLAGLPWMRVPLSMAHEKAHQRGVTTEAEATFLGFVATTLADDALARYSGTVHAMGQLLGALRSADRSEWERLARTRHPGIVRDQVDFSEYIARYEGVPERVQSAVNDRYLRANRVPGGIRSYSRSARLLVEFARQQGGVLIPVVDSLSRGGV